MEYRNLGNTGLEVSVLGFGASPLGDAFRAIDPAEGDLAVHMAIDNGINFFDVSPYYGLTLAEERLGKALVGKRDQVVLATKCGRYGADKFDFSASRIAASIDESLSRLKTDYVDLLQLHDVEFGSLTQILEESIPSLVQIQKLGKTRFIGVTGYPLHMLSRIVQTVPIDTVLTYCRYNLMITDLDEVLTPIARRCGVGLINASGLHMGILTGRGGPDWHPAPIEVREAGKQVVAFCAAHQIDAAEVALRFCFDHPYASSTLVGMSTRQHVKSNLRALRAISEPGLLEEIKRIVDPVVDFVWPSGKPENFDPNASSSNYRRPSPEAL